MVLKKKDLNQTQRRRARGDKVSRHFTNPDNLERLVNEHFDFIDGVPSEREWLKDRIFDADMMLTYLKEETELILSISTQPRPLRTADDAVQLSDIGTIHQLRKRMKKVSAAVEYFLRMVHRHPAFRDEVAEIQEMRLMEELETGSDRASLLGRARTRFQKAQRLAQQIEELNRLQIDLKALRRHITWVLRKKESLQKETELGHQLDQVRTQFVSLQNSFTSTHYSIATSEK